MQTKLVKQLTLDDDEIFGLVVDKSGKMTVVSRAVSGSEQSKVLTSLLSLVRQLQTGETDDDRPDFT